MLCSQARRLLRNNLIFLLRTFLVAEQTLVLFDRKTGLHAPPPLSAVPGTADNWPRKPACHLIHLTPFQFVQIEAVIGVGGGNGIMQTL